MKLKNKYQKFSKISEQKFREIIRCFALDLTASDTAKMTGISVRSINPIFLKIRYRIAALCEQSSPLSGVVELDESYFGARRIRGKRGRGASGKTIVFGILKRNGVVYTEIVPDASKASLIKVIRGHISADSEINTDGWKAYDGLVDMGYESITVFITVLMSLPVGSNISMVLNLFGVMLRVVWLNFMVFPKRCFICISKKRSLDLTTVMKT